MFRRYVLGATAPSTKKCRSGCAHGCADNNYAPTINPPRPRPRPPSPTPPIRPVKFVNSGRVVVFALSFVGVRLLSMERCCFLEESVVSPTPIPLPEIENIAFCGESDLIPSYQVCNGLMNQLLGHAAYISSSIKTNSPLIKIPDAFTVDGTQIEVGSNGILKDVFPNKNNSIPLSAMIDSQKLIDVVRRHGSDACFVPHENIVSSDLKTDKCPWLDELRKSDDELTLDIVNAMTPSLRLSHVLKNELDALESQLQLSHLSISDGVCLHHRNGADWRNHCSMWNGNNCLESEGLPIVDLVKDRIPSEYAKKWVYYISDEELSNDVLFEFESRGLKVINRDKHQLLGDNDIELFVKVSGAGLSLGRYRDILAATDFFICDRIDSFIGNSVSTFSAVQIAKRAGNATWYNSRSIPLAPFLNVYHVPFVYSYTELSEASKKDSLKASIRSATDVFGLKTEIHVLYHGFKDTEFLLLLRGMGVRVHNHDPKWLTMVDEMGNNNKSYLEAWQRMDIPLFISAEYALFFDTDTIIREHFTLLDFGGDITPRITLDPNQIRKKLQTSGNAGVALINVPKLRHTYNKLVEFMSEHARVGQDFQSVAKNQGEIKNYLVSGWLTVPKK